jgi:DNA-directed RNA polymerase specialized sigma24 family protein
VDSIDSEVEDVIARLSGRSDPAQDLMQRDMLVLLDRAMSSLDPLTEQLVLEKYAAGYSYKEMSARHGIPLGTLCPKVMRALQEIRARIEASPDLMKELRVLLRR